MMDTLFNMTPAFSVYHPSNGGATNTKRRGQLALEYATKSISPPNLTYRRLREASIRVAFASRHRPMLGSVGMIVGVGSPSQVYQAVVCAVTVQVTTLAIGRAGADKRHQHHLMNRMSLLGATPSTQADHRIPVASHGRMQAPPHFLCLYWLLATRPPDYALRYTKQLSRLLSRNTARPSPFAHKANVGGSQCSVAMATPNATIIPHLILRKPWNWTILDGLVKLVLRHARIPFNLSVFREPVGPPSRPAFVIIADIIVEVNAP